jgi:trigger factor
MDVLLEPLEGAQRKFRVVFSDEEVRSRVDKEIRSAIKGLKVPGYRVGHVPPSYIRSRGSYLSSIYESVTEELRQNVIDALVNEGSGTVVFLDPEPFSISRDHEGSGITVQGFLEIFELPGDCAYEGISLSPEQVPAVSEAEIAEEIASLSKKAGTQFKTDLPEDLAIEEGDLVSFSFSFTHPDTGLPYENHQTVNVGDPSHPEALTRALIGRKVGESFSEKLPFNIPGRKKQARARVEPLDATLTVETIKRLEPATREELFKVLSSPDNGKTDSAVDEEGTTLDALVAKRLLEKKVSEILTRKMDELVLEILSRNAIPVPEQRIKLECDRMAASGVPASDLDKEKVKRETLWWFTLDGLAKKMTVQPDMKRVEHEYLTLVRQGGSPDKDETRRREYIEQAFLSARRRLTEEMVLRKSSFPGSEEFFGPEGLLDRLGWKDFGVSRVAIDHSHHEHDHTDHVHDGHSH